MSEPASDHPRIDFDRLYGLEIRELSDERARGEVKVRDELKQPLGLVHGGVYAAIAESLAVFGTAHRVTAEGKLASALAQQTNVLHPITAGTIHAVAVPRHRGSTTWVWEVEITDDEGRLCVLTRTTVAVRER